MRTLFVAAGGGGDAVGILLARRILDPEGEGPALISTCAWERLRVDPMPGPRPISGFTALGSVNGRRVEILATSQTVPSRRSTLPRLAGEPDVRIFLHDFERGAQGLAEQLRYLAQTLGAEKITVVDVGGDVVARGGEPTLLSPLADSLTLAGALLTGVPVDLAVVGPGSDAELPELQVIQRLVELTAHRAGDVTPADVRRWERVLDWHPTEASALVAASAMGERGAVEMRRGKQPTPLTDHCHEVWAVPHPFIQQFPLARAVEDSHSLAMAVEAMERVAVNEIAYEQRKATCRTPFRASARTFEEIAREAISKGATHITTRRLLEQRGSQALCDDSTADPIPQRGHRRGGLWVVGSLVHSDASSE